MQIPAIHIHNATLTYQNRVIFSNLNLSIPAGTWVGLIGPSGVGKTSLLRAIANLPSPEAHFSGSIETDNGIAASTQTAYLPQSDLLLPWLTVIQNITLRSKLQRQRGDEARLLHEKAELLLDKVKLSHARDLYPHQLSGGMRQRAALVRVLLEEKPIMLLDEPFSAVDAITRYQLHGLAIELMQHKTVLFITHDPTEALRLAHLIYILQGDPVTLKQLVTLSTTTPRTLPNPVDLHMQNSLFEQLAAQ
ncbi:MAG: ABC transporter ATP-binding protein [Gammaproteobacteria bacterium]|nr:ABC transporter ATP-binding protein [Gammaproteobacteria bacterium]